eukprot:3494143-Pyramimonas_sp.AAC.1
MTQAIRGGRAPVPSITANHRASACSATSGNTAKCRQWNPSALTAEAGLYFLEMARISEGSRRGECGRMPLPSPWQTISKPTALLPDDTELIGLGFEETHWISHNDSTTRKGPTQQALLSPSGRFPTFIKPL